MPIENSIVSYPERGDYGSSKFRGNCSGLLIKDIVQHYGAKSLLDPMEGSGTARDVCAELGVEYDGFDILFGFDALTDILPPKKYDMIFCHPPYWNIIRYSDDPRDLSTIKCFEDFIDKLFKLLERLTEYLAKDGFLVLLVGDVRKKGQIYPIGAYLQVFHRKELKDKIIKVLHNNMRTTGKGRFYGDIIQFAHEEVLVFRPWKKLTWAELVCRALKEIGEEASCKEIYEIIEKHPKITTNPTWKATVRKELQENAVQVERGIWKGE